MSQSFTVAQVGNRESTQLRLIVTHGTLSSVIGVKSDECRIPSPNRALRQSSASSMFGALRGGWRNRATMSKEVEGGRRGAMAGPLLVLCLHTLGPSAFACDSTTGGAVVAAATLKPSSFDQRVLDQAVDGMTPADGSAQVDDAVADEWSWVLSHCFFQTRQSGPS